jgi:hypothetical protein
MNMGHQAGPCEFLDVLEEAAVLGSAVHIQLKGGQSFDDSVRDVVTQDGADFAIFHAHGSVPLDDISDARRAQPLEATYDGKLGV